MMRGFPMDHDLLKTYKQNVRRDVRDIQEWINKVCDHDMNTGSSVQMQKFFYEDLQVKKVMKGRGRAARPTLNTGALEIIAKRSPVLGPLCYAMSDERSLSHFDENMLSIRLPDDGRAHTEMNIAGTETMRFTSTEDCFGSGLNMQNINRMPEE
jgi:DNA polymerase I-like protein with 3'-5' exonuclease and polymerase domains